MIVNSPRYLTTKELADLLRIRERKVYEMAAAGEVPCARAMGKLLFPRAEVEAWLAANTTGPRVSEIRPQVVIGSHDPLLDWALRESRCGLATNFDSSLHGLDQFAAGEGIVAGLHIPDRYDDDWNVSDVRAKAGNSASVLVEWARRERGLVVTPGSSINSLSQIAGCRFAPRQRGAGSQIMFERLLKHAGIEPASIEATMPSRSETDAVLMVQEGKADCCFGLASIASQYRLDFVPLASERYDLLVDRKAWFDLPFQLFLKFCISDAFKARAKELVGYDVTGQFIVHLNL